MGKKRIIKKSGKGMDQGRKERALSKIAKKRIDRGVLQRAEHRVDEERPHEQP